MIEFLSKLFREKTPDEQLAQDIRDCVKKFNSLMAEAESRKLRVDYTLGSDFSFNISYYSSYHRISKVEVYRRFKETF